MKVYDISREFFSAKVYPGDPTPYKEPIQRLEMGDECNVTAYYACAHAATHVDAPRHYYEDGKTIDQMDLNRFMGPCSVVTVRGIVTGKQVDRLLASGCQKRILFHGDGQAYLAPSAAFALAEAGVLLVGTDASSIGAYGEEIQPHRELLGAEIPVLEGLKLRGVREGNYFLIALPILMGGMDGAPVRAVLLES